MLGRCKALATRQKNIIKGGLYDDKVEGASKNETAEETERRDAAKALARLREMARTAADVGGDAYFRDVEGVMARVRRARESCPSGS